MGKSELPRSSFATIYCIFSSFLYTSAFTYQSINLPDSKSKDAVERAEQTLEQHDEEALNTAVRLGADLVGVSFCDTAARVHAIRRALRSRSAENMGVILKVVAALDDHFLGCSSRS